jgi:glutamine synthetase
MLPSRKVARIICDVHRPDGEPFEGDPRSILKRAIRAARERGYLYNTGSELEFFIQVTDWELDRYLETL